MKISLNTDKDMVESVRQSLKDNDGYCPCKLDHIPENKCMCKEFRDKIDDETFEGYCHCTLYYKSLN